MKRNAPEKTAKKLKSQLKVAKRIMRENREVLRKLAKA